jgi:Cytochrome c7 and related cytochrome c
MRALEPITAILAAAPPWAAGFAALFLAGGLLFGMGGGSGPQPIAFNHAKHVANGVGCTDCHAGATQGQHATLPPLSTCLTCHESALTQSAEEAKIRAASAAGQELQWTQVTRVPPHVYFPHRRHVQVAKFDCGICHGDMARLTVPPTSRFRKLDMNDCIGCHDQNKVYTDCNDCHR